MICLLILLNICTACGQSSQSKTDSPDIKVINLEQELLEISGLVVTDSLIIAVQDEAGMLYSLSDKDWSILDRLDFGLPGDYEAICIRNGKIYVVDSRGIIYELKKHNDEIILINMYALNYPEVEYEGIWVEESGEYAYLVGRKAQNNSKLAYSERYIHLYSFENLTEEKSIRIPVEKIWTFYVEMERRYPLVTAIGSELRFSDLLHDDDSGNWFILCSRPALLIELNSGGALEDIIEIDPSILPQPEAMTWTSDGGLAVASEGVLGPARIIIFPPRKK